MSKTTSSSNYRTRVDTQLQLSPFNFVRSGDYSNSSGVMSARGDTGRYWVSEVDYVSNAKRIVFNSNALSLQNGSNGKGGGYTLRCLGR